jgi:hypothetical protein
MRLAVLVVGLLLSSAGCGSKPDPADTDPGPQPEPKTTIKKSADGTEQTVTSIPD